MADELKTRLRKFVRPVAREADCSAKVALKMLERDLDRLANRLSPGEVDLNSRAGREFEICIQPPPRLLTCVGFHLLAEHVQVAGKIIT